MSERLVALSYDDSGPSPENTPELLEILASAGARATFFVVGAEVDRYPGLATRIVESGHELGNHSYSHRNVRDLDERETMAGDGARQPRDRAGGSPSELVSPAVRKAVAWSGAGLPERGAHECPVVGRLRRHDTILDRANRQ